MPLIYYLCEFNHSVSKFYRQAKDAPATVPCGKPDCGKDAKRQLKAPNSASKVVMDNGFQARAVEVNPDIVEINEARSNKDYGED
jgi:tetraacyldisaccharide-1-P 4'-kinase